MEEKDKKGLIPLLIICIILFLISGVLVYFVFIKKDNNENTNNKKVINYDERETYNDIISSSKTVDEIANYKVVSHERLYKNGRIETWYYLLDTEKKEILAYNEYLAIISNFKIKDNKTNEIIYDLNNCKLNDKNDSVWFRELDDKNALSTCDYYIIDGSSDNDSFVQILVDRKNKRLGKAYERIEIKDNELISYDDVIVVLNDYRYYDEDDIRAKYGLFNIKTMEEVLDTKYDELYYLINNKFIGTINDKYGLYSNNGEELLKVEYDIISLIKIDNKDVIYARKNNEVKIFDENFKDITNEIDKEKYKYSIFSDELKNVKNEVTDFDLSFLKNENQKENKVYSPLSIRFALEMLNEGANGETKKQISNVLGDYYTGRYVNSKNLSLANALFVKDSKKDSIKEDYVKLISDKYNADIKYDSFESSDIVNNWIKEKTFDLIHDVVDDISSKDFVLLNALAINMEWMHKIQLEYWKSFEGNYIDFYTKIERYETVYEDKPAPAEINAVINKYDIINILGKDKIRETVREEYQKWLDEGHKDSCNTVEPDADTYIKNTITDEYFEKMNKAYKQYSSSTDFEFYDDKDVKVFAKDLKKYNGTKLQYIGIMPKTKDLDKYIKDINANDLNNLIKKIKKIELDNFNEGVITYIYGKIPMFKFDYELKLIEDLNKLGITDVFDAYKSDLSNMFDDIENKYISEAIHKTNIEFSNEGIKAAAVSMMGGEGGGGCEEFVYYFKPPIEKIDLTFDKPYMFLIRNKDTGEVWFAGTVYEPTTDMELDYSEYLSGGGN